MESIFTTSGKSFDSFYIRVLTSESNRWLRPSFRVMNCSYRVIRSVASNSYHILLFGFSFSSFAGSAAGFSSAFSSLFSSAFFSYFTSARFFSSLSSVSFSSALSSAGLSFSSIVFSSLLSLEVSFSILT